MNNMSNQTTPHNPDNLTPEQVGVADGWRLLDENEILSQFDNRPPYTCQAWLEFKWSSEDLGYNGGSPNLTYRTRLSRAELRAARGVGGGEG